MIHFTGASQPPRSRTQYISFRLGALSSHPFHLCVPISSHPQGKGSTPSEKTWEACSGFPTVPPFPFLSIMWPLGLLSRMTLKACYWFSCHFRSYTPTRHLPLSESLKTQFGKKEKKKITHVISGAGLMERPFQEAGCEVLGGSNRDALKDSVLTWAELFLHLQCLTAVLVVGSQQLLKRESGRANHFHDCHTGSLLCWKWTSCLLGLHILY